MRNVVLHGRLKKLFGGPFRFDVQTAGEAIRALAANFPTFVKALEKGSYEVVRGQHQKGMRLVEDDINTFNLGQGDLHLIPVTKGSKNGGGALKAIVGVALIGVAIFASGGTLAAPLAGLVSSTGGLTMWGTVAMIGLAATVTGISQTLTPKEKPQDEIQKQDSFAFNGPGNATEQGNPVPLIYGRVMTGSLPISFGIDIEDIAVTTGQTPGTVTQV